MAGQARRLIRIEVDRAAVAKLIDFGEVLIEAPPNDEADLVQLVYINEDLDARQADPDSGLEETVTLSVTTGEQQRP